jgi:trans-aconitate methyltransferase
MATAARIEREWKGKIPPPEGSTGWMPSDPAQFLVLLIEAIAESPAGANQFLEIGCGPGTKMLLAQEIFGLQAYGIDSEIGYIKAAWELGLTAEPADALGWGTYRDFGIVFFNRCFHGTGEGAVKQDALEKQVWADMAPGAVVIAMNLLAPPPQEWIIVTDDWADGRRGVWIKPLSA